MLKPQPNHDRYIAVLRRMTPEQRLQKAWDLTEAMRELLLEGLRRRHPTMPAGQRHQLYLERLAKCHNRNY